MRKEVPEVGWGRFEVLPDPNSAILAIRYEWRNNAVLFLHNLGAKPVEVRLAAQESHGKTGLLVNLLSEDHSKIDGDRKHRILLERYGYRWYRVGGLDYLLQRSEV